MSEVVYAIVFSGGVVEGFQTFAVKAHLSKMLKADANKMAMLFSGKQVVLKRTPDKQQAIKYGSALKKIGADVKIKAIKQDPAAKKAAEADPSGLSLAPMEGYIVPPKPPVPEPQLDLSSLATKENDGTPLVESSGEVEELELDLSSYSVNENDGSPLVEPSNEPVPQIEAPDFGLDEPGAVLDTIKDEREKLDPDVSGLSLAEVGVDLMDETEKPKAPAAPVPDTSNLQLEPNEA